jgi:hypothetical protein
MMTPKVNGFLRFLIITPRTLRVLQKNKETEKGICYSLKRPPEHGALFQKRIIKETEKRILGF